MKVINIFIFLISFFLALEVQAKNYACDGSLSNNSYSEVDATVHFSAYLTRLLNDGVIDLLKLQEVQLKLKNERALTNPLPDSPATKFEVSLHKQQIDSYIESGSIDLDRLNSFLENLIADNNKVQKAKQRVETETHSTVEKIAFHRVEAGISKIYTRSGYHDSTVKIENPLLVQSTVVTKKMWSDLMKENIPDVKENNKPVTELLWWAAVLYANRLSEQEGLPPVYNLDNIRFDNEKDILHSSATVLDPHVKINAPNNDIYQTTGYRLPTMAEFFYLLSDRSRSRVQSFSKETEANIQDYVWCKENSEDSIQDVAGRAAFIIDGKAFFDLYGNVQQFLHDVVTLKPENPASIRYLGGSSFSESCDEVKLHRVMSNVGIVAKDIKFGFRLVRSLPK